MFQTRKPRLKLEEQQRREAREGALYDGRFMPTFSTQPIVSDTNLNFETQTWRLNDDAYHSIALDSVKQDLVPLSIDSWIQNRVFSVLWKPVSSGDVEQAKLRATDKEGRLRAWTQEADPKSEFISDLTRLRAPSTDRNEIKTCDKPVCNGIIDALWWSDRLNAAVFVTPVGWGLSQKVISVWSPDRGLLLSTPATDNDIGPCSLSDLRLYCVETSATNPGALFAYDLQTGKQSLVVSANPAAVTARYLPAEKIEWRSPTKDEMFGYLVSPRNPASPPPLVVVQYIARGFLRGIGGEVDIQDLASRGIAVFVVNKGPPQEGVYRRKTGYHRDEMDLRGTDLAAYLAGISLLEHRGKIDGSRVGIWGQSHGAGVTELALQSGMPFAAASLAGDSDSHIAFYYMVGPAYQDILRTRDLTPEDLLDKNNPISIINTVHQIRAPILINVADHELLFTADYYATVSDAGLPIEMHVYQNEWHQKWQPAHLMSVYRRNRDWFSFWLQGKRPGDDIVQYQRWDQLKAKLEAKLGPDKPTGSAIWAKALADFEALMTRDRLRRAKLHAHCHR
jgi:dienelactone hydrolase